MTFLSRRSRTTTEATVTTAPSQQQSVFSSVPTSDTTRQTPCSYWVRRRLQSESRSA